MTRNSTGGGRRPSFRSDFHDAVGSGLFAVLLAVLLACSVEAAGLSGKVLDPQGAVVANARLRLVDREGGPVRSTRSDDDGVYSFLNLPSGNYLLEGETANASLSASVETEVAGDAVADLRLALSANSVEIVVTAASTPATQQEVGRALDAVGSDSIALRNEYSLGEVLRSLPGVRVRQLRGPGSWITVQTRGLRNQDTAMLIDGMRFRDAASPQGDATAFYQDMAIIDVDRVEFLRGTGSSLYGSNAIGGVISIVSHQGAGSPHGEIRTEGGGLGMLRGVARGGDDLANGRFQYSGGLSHVNVTKGYREGSPFRNSSAQGSARFLLQPNLHVSGRAWGTDSFRSLVENPTFPEATRANFPASGIVPARALPVSQLELFERGAPFDAGNATFVPDQIDPDNRLSTRFLMMASTLRHDLSPGSSYQLSFQSLRTGRRYRDGPAGPSLFDPAVSNDSRYDGQTHTLLARTDNRLGASHLVSFGYEFERESYSNFNTDEGSTPTENISAIAQANHAAFVQDQVRLLQDRMHLTVSGRVQRFTLGTASYSGEPGPYIGASVDRLPGAYTGDVALAYFARSTGTKFRAHAGNGFRAPSLYERFGGDFSSYSGGFSYWGDPRLSPEQSVAADFGIDQWLFDSRVRLSGTYFYTDLSETIVFDFANFPADDVFGRYGGYRNAGGGIARGVELSGQAAFSASTRVRGSYLYANSDSRTPTIGPDHFQIPGHSAHVYTATVTQWIVDRINVTFDLFAASDYILSPYGAQSRKLAFQGPVKADIVFQYEVPLVDGKRMEFYGKVENVLNVDYYENGFGSPGAWMIGGFRFQF